MTSDNNIGCIVYTQSTCPVLTFLAFITGVARRTVTHSRQRVTITAVETATALGTILSERACRTRLRTVGPDKAVRTEAVPGYDVARAPVLTLASFLAVLSIFASAAICEYVKQQ